MIIPTRDRQELLRQALASVLAQRHVELEVIVVDDGSRESCGPVVADARDDRVRLLVHGRTKGVSEARNSGIADARMQWLSFLDDDDLLAPDNLSSHLVALSRDPAAAWSCVGLIHIDDNVAVVGSSAPPAPEGVKRGLRSWNVIPAPCCIVASRDLVEETGGFNPTLSCFADWDLWLRLSARTRLVSTSRPLAAYRFHGRNMSGDPYVWDHELPVMRRIHGVPEDSDVRAESAQLHRARAWEYLRAGQARRSAAEMWAVARRDRDWRALVLAAGLGAMPGVMGGLDATRSRRRVPPAWRVEADAWLKTFRPATHVVSSHR